MLKDMLQKRRMMPKKQSTDFFDYVLEELAKEGTPLTEGIALDLMFVLLFASFETTSLALTVAIKYLSEYPLVLQKLTVRFMRQSISLSFSGLDFYILYQNEAQLTLCKNWQEEHEAILKRREDPNSHLTWKEYKSMTYTFQVS